MPPWTTTLWPSPFAVSSRSRSKKIRKTANDPVRDGMNPPPLVVGRLAPSPTGAQHVGNARTYLIAWLSARSRGGKVLLRIEDIASPRIKPGAAEQAGDDLRWLGLDWDGEPVVQTERLSLYQSALY